MSESKFDRMEKLSDDKGVIKAAAMDQRGSLVRRLSNACDVSQAEVTDGMMEEFKEPMNYVLATTTQFSEGCDEVILKARGRAINTAVDAAEITRNRFLTEVDIQDISTKTEELEDEEGETSNVSAIEITLRMGE